MGSDLIAEFMVTAVKVDKETEFNALMKYYDGLGFKHTAMLAPFRITDFEYGKCFTFHDKWFSVKDDDIEYTIIPFQDFAKEHNIKLPQTISQDNIELFIGDKYYCPQQKGFKKLQGYYPEPMEFTVCEYTDNKGQGIFAQKQAALDWIEKMNKPEKKYLKIERDLNNSGIKIGSEVIVTDGSYMIDAQTKEHVSGIYFNKDGLHEVLKVTKVNQPFETDYSVLSEILSVHNNCEITGFDKRKYYCSRINIKAI